MSVLLHPASWRRRSVGAASIREVVFGVEDGVVQNMALIAGMVGGGLTNRVVVFAGAINAIAGVLSMSMGTYLSSRAEIDVADAMDGEAAPPHNSPGRDAAVMATAYAVGAMAPLLPFTIGLSRPTSLVLAMIVTAVTLFALGVGKAVLSGQQRAKSGLQMLTLASAAGLLGYLIGVAARAIFDLQV
jgi:VIT1/CCC1 family predicted Fe2+/Mn2+ transporter